MVKRKPTKWPPAIKFTRTPRAQTGWPCFYCAKPARECRSARGRCCHLCRGKRSH